MTPSDLEVPFRAAMSRLVSGVCVITAREPRGAGADLAMTATSVVSVSLEPPTVLFCVHADARLREVIEPGSHWAVSILDGTALAAADWLASPGRPTLGQLDRIAHTRGEHSGAALLDQASAWLECETDWIRGAGSHDVVTGRVLRAQPVPGRSGAIVHAHGRMAPYS